MADPFDPKEFSQSLQEFDQLIQGLIAQGQQQQQQQQEPQPPQEVAPPQPEQSQAEATPEPTEKPAETGVDEFIKSLLQEPESPKEQPINVLEVLRDISKLDELAAQNPQLAYSISRMLLHMRQFAESMPRPSGSQPQPQEPPPQTKESAQPVDPQLQSLIGLRDYFAQALEAARRELEEIRRTPAPTPETTTKEPSIEDLFSETKEPQRQTEPLLAQIARDVQEAKALSRINLLDQAIRHINQEINARTALQALQSQYVQNALQTLQNSYSEVREHIANRLDEIFTKVNEQLGVSPYGELIAHATRNQLLSSGMNPDQEMLRIAVLPKHERQAAIENFVRQISRAYIQNAKTVASGRIPGQQPARAEIPPPANPTPAPPEQPSPKGDVFSDASREFAQALEAAEKYLSGFPFPSLRK